MDCCIRTPDRTLYDGASTMVVARSEDGEFAVLDGHAPMLVSLRSGAIRVRTDAGGRVFACRGGVLRVRGNVVAILTPSGVPIEELDLPAIRQRLEGLSARAAEAPEDARLRQEIAELEAMESAAGARRD